MDDFEEGGNDRADKARTDEQSAGGVSIRADTTRKGGRPRVPANVEWLDSLGDGGEQLLADGNAILALGFNVLGRRGSDHADDLRAGLSRRVATCLPYKSFRKAYMPRILHGRRLTPTCCFSYSPVPTERPSRQGSEGRADAHAPIRLGHLCPLHHPQRP